jgi:hypothetical protein
MKYELVSTFTYLSSIWLDPKLYFIRG